MQFKMHHILTVSYVLTPRSPYKQYLAVSRRQDFPWEIIKVTKKETIISDIRKHSRDFLNSVHAARKC